MSLITHLVPPALQAGDGLLLSQVLQDSVHSFGPALVRVQTGTQAHSAPTRRLEHLRVSLQQRGYARTNPAHLRSVDLKPEAAAPTRTCRNNS